MTITPEMYTLDIETVPMRSWHWALGKQRILPHQIDRDWFILSWAAKKLYGAEVMSDILSVEEVLELDDSRIMKSVWEVLNKADIVITHNGEKFDHPKINTRCLVNGILPPSSYQIIDTLKHSRKIFAFSSNAQKYITEFLILPQKMETDFDLWIRCVNGDQESLDYMEQYNRADVGGLEELYLKIRPWIRSHPNMAIYGEAVGEACPNCGSSDMRDDGYYTTPAGQFEARRCNDCGAPSRKRLSALVQEQRPELVSIAR